MNRYFNKITKNVHNNINQMKKAPLSFIPFFFLCFFLAIFIVFLLFLFISSLYILINPYIFIIFLLLSLFYLKKKKLKFSEKDILLFIVIGWLLVQLLIVFSIEVEYSNIKSHYSQEYLLHTRNGLDNVNATWLLVDSFNESYNGAYGSKGIRFPNRQISNYKIPMTIISPIFRFYFFDIEKTPKDEFYKLLIVQNLGNCGEFASSIKFLINDVTRFDTRAINMEGADHEFPEININNEWWIFDRTYTTPSKPIKSYNYASFLFIENNGLFNCISDLIDCRNEASVLSEHGFNSSNLTITAILDITSSENDNEPANDAVIEIFSYVNSYDPLVNIGKTDKNGHYSTILRSDKHHLIVVKNENLEAIGLKEVYLPQNDNSSVTIYLHKYA